MIYIVLPVHNRRAVTERFVKALLAQVDADYRLMLVDDGCTDGTAAMVHAMLPADRLVVLEGNGQLWWAGALQLAWRHLSTLPAQAAGDAVLLINDDVTFDRDFLSGGLAVLAENPQACIQAMGIDPATGERDLGAVVDLTRLRFRAARRGETPHCLSTRGLLMSSSTFVGSGGFRPHKLPHYLSDYEFTLRLARGGAALLCDPRFRLVADHSTSGDEGFDGSRLRDYLERSLSNRAKYNPKHWAALACMVSPWWAVPLLVARIWLGFGRKALRVVLRPPAERVATADKPAQH
jgi:GT2 family glycosyltransferase